MSVAQIEAELETLSLEELRAVEVAARRQQGQRTGGVLSGPETRLFSTINEPLPGGDELQDLRLRRETHSLTEDELARLIELENEREVIWARKLRAVSDLADLRGQDFESLYRQLGLTLRSES